MKELNNEHSFQELNQDELALILMTPRWSYFHKSTEKFLNEIKEEENLNSRFYKCTEDDPSKNPALINWSEPHRDIIYPNSFSGAGAIILVSKGKPYFVQHSTYKTTKEELLKLIKEKLEKY